ncbi:hypothetical protein [Aquimarina agarilytica]|uniref:hypothetical protein n=1 Tax=Aquimarina agarilytica TaxID=1087449 RepID=UPI00028A07A6|nr:hypothetical protein [Aquimarina agarilytica]
MRFLYLAILILFFSCKDNKINKVKKEEIISTKKIDVEASKIKTLNKEKKQTIITNDKVIYSVINNFLKYETIKSNFDTKIISNNDIPNRHNPNQIDKREKLGLNENDIIEYYITPTKKILYSATIFDKQVIQSESIKIGMTINEVSKKLNTTIDSDAKNILITDIENSTHLTLNFKSNKLFSINVKINFLG